MHHKTVRDSIPKKWSDSTELIRIINFAIITEFYYEEMMLNHIDWDSDKFHKEFKKWITGAVKWIEVNRKKKEIELENAYPDISPDFFKQNPIKFTKTESKKYDKVTKIEKEIDNKDEEILLGLIKYRGFFWT